jgi:N-formylglutamate amidohydrolase
MPMTPLLLHIPHDSTIIPPDERADFLLPEAELRAESLRLTDAHTATLYAEGLAPDDFVRAEVSRLVVDVERFADDAQERCAKVGMGATYVRTADGRPLRTLTPERRAELMARHYWPHHRRLDAASAARLGRFGRCLVLDAHSFPTGPLPTQISSGPSPEIGVGTQPGHTPPELRDVVVGFFRERGYDVGVDVPFSGAMVPNACFGCEPRLWSVMVEVRRDLYMDEATGAPHAGFTRTQAVLTELRAELARFAAT